MTNPTGRFIVSLDFELYWGVRDRIPLERYKQNLLGAREAVPRLLAAFDKYQVHATWATVGFLFFSDKDELLTALPDVRPEYKRSALSPYAWLSQIGPNEAQDPCHYAGSLIARIRDCPGQEIGTHTFSHYYCLEEGQTEESFRADLEAARRAAASRGVALRSVVFPRNQFNPSYLGACRDSGIISYRGNQHSWLYKPVPSEKLTALRRVGRMLDSYVKLSGYNHQPSDRRNLDGIVNVPAGRFLRPVSQGPRWLEPLRLRRIKREMLDAARTGTAYHLWWHPHNFGSLLEANMSFLTRILEHYRQLKDSYGMVSENMRETAERMLSARGLGRASAPACAPLSE